MIYKKIESSDIELGKPLPWDIYDNHGKKLVGQGKVIESERLLNGLVTIGFYASAEDNGDENNAIRSPFTVIRDIHVKLKELLPRFMEGVASGDTRNILSHFTTKIIQLADSQPDAVIAAVHLYCERPYSISHTLRIALLCSVFSKELHGTKLNRAALVSAALTSNISILRLQDYLEEQVAPLNQEQKLEILEHPTKAVQLLKQFGIHERLWLDAIRYHHESDDGKGYPKGLTSDRIPLEAKVISLADKYSAIISPRKYRDPIEPTQCLRNLFVEKGKHFEEELCLRFIKMMGIYPPGTFVRLKNGDKAVVVSRPDASTKRMHPRVCAYQNAYDHVYPVPAFLDSSDERYRIEKLCSRERLPYQFDDVWN